MLAKGMMMPLHLGEKSAKPVTTVQDYAGTSVNVQILDISNKWSGHFPAAFVAEKSSIQGARRSPAELVLTK